MPEYNGITCGILDQSVDSNQDSTNCKRKYRPEHDIRHDYDKNSSYSFVEVESGKLEIGLEFSSSIDFKHVHIAIDIDGSCRVQRLVPLSYKADLLTFSATEFYEREDWYMHPWKLRSIEASDLGDTTDPESVQKHQHIDDRKHGTIVVSVFRLEDLEFDYESGRPEATGLERDDDWSMKTLPSESTRKKGISHILVQDEKDIVRMEEVKEADWAYWAAERRAHCDYCIVAENGHDFDDDHLPYARFVLAYRGTDEIAKIAAGKHDATNHLRTATGSPLPPRSRRLLSKLNTDYYSSLSSQHANSKLAKGVHEAGRHHSRANNSDKYDDDESSVDIIKNSIQIPAYPKYLKRKLVEDESACSSEVQCNSKGLFGDTKATALSGCNESMQ